MTERIRVGVAGLGAVAQAVHLPLLERRWDLAEVAAVCDLSRDLREEIGQQYGVPPARRYANVGDLIADAAVDGVLLLTSGSHGPAARLALAGGTAVFCEKPLAYTVAEADRLAAAETAAGRSSLLLAYMKERDGAVARLREHLAAVNDIRAVEVRVLHPASESQLAFAQLRRPTGTPAGALDPAAEETLLDTALGARTPSWFRDLYRGIVLSSLIHDTALLRGLFGGLTAVDDVQVWPAGTTRPSVEVSGQLPGGARARMAWHYLAGYPTYRETLSVHHDSGSLTVTFGTPYLLNHPSELAVLEPAPGGYRESTYRSTTGSFEQELVEFHRMVTAGAAPITGVAEGRADISTSLRIMRRLAEQQGIDIGGEAAAAGLPEE